MKKIFIVLILQILLFSCGNTNTLPSASVKAMELAVEDIEDISIDGRTVLSLSPTGKWLAASEKQLSSIVLTIYERENKKKVLECDQLGFVDFDSLKWSPDGRYLAFTSKPFRRSVNSYLWVADPGEGKIISISREGKIVIVSSLGELVNTEVPMDVSPFWSDSGKNLYFVRYIPAEDERWQAFIYSSTLSGGVKEEAALPEVRDFSVQKGLFKTDSHFFYTYHSQDTDDPGNGLWKIPLTGGSGQKIMGLHPEWQSPPAALQRGGRGNYALFHYYNLADYNYFPVDSYFQVMDIKKGEIKPVKQIDFQKGTAFSLHNALLSPDGSKILYVYFDITADKYIVAVRDLEGEEDNPLFYSDTPIGGPEDIFFLTLDYGLSWTKDDEILISNNDEAYILKLKPTDSGENTP